MHYDVVGDELVSVIIPTKNGYDNIERCVSSIIDKTDYRNYEIIIADNGSDNPHMQDLYQRFAKKLGDRFHVEGDRYSVQLLEDQQSGGAESVRPLLAVPQRRYRSHQPILDDQNGVVRAAGSRRRRGG